MVSVPRLLIIGERDYCRSDAHWMEQLIRITSILNQYPRMALQIRNKYHPQSWSAVEAHVDEWMNTHPNQCLLNGWIFPTKDCARHLPEISLCMGSANRVRMCGGSVHSHSALENAVRFGCHYIQYGAVFPTSKPVVPTGLASLQAICEASALPVLAVGGISSPQQIHLCLSVGAYGISVGSWIMQSQNPASVIDHIWEEISQFMSNQ